MSDDTTFAGRRPGHHASRGPVSFLEDLTAPEWMARGLCAQTDPESFFPEKGGSTREAKRTCFSCEVRAECLDYALEHQERFGIWGGLSERERRRLKSAPQAGPRPCRRPGCPETIPATAHGSKRYHDKACAIRAREDLYIAALDQNRIVTAYTAGASMRVIAKQHRAPLSVITRILDAHGVRRPRGHRTQEAS